MSTADKLTYLNTTKGMIKDAVNTVGVDVADSDTFREYVDKIKAIYKNLVKIEGLGTYVILNPTLRGKIMVFPYGNTTQDSTPSFANKVPVKNVTEEHTLVVNDRNMLDINCYESGKIIMGADASDSKCGRGSNYISVKPNTKYTFSAKQSVYEIELDEYAEDKTQTHFSLTQNNSLITITTQQTTTYLRWCFNYDNSTTVTKEIAEGLELRIEEGEERTTPQRHTHTLNLGTLELCKIGTYQDYLYKSSDKWYKKEWIDKYTFTGSESYTKSGAVDVYYLPNFFKNKTLLYSNENQPFCNALTGTTPASGASGMASSANNTTAIPSGSGSAGSRLYIKTDAYSTKEELATAMVGNIIYWIKETPTDIEITDTTLIGQLEALSGYTGYTIVTDQNGDANAQMSMKVSAIKDV